MTDTITDQPRPRREAERPGRRQGEEPARAGGSRRPAPARRRPAWRLLGPDLPALLRRALLDGDAVVDFYGVEVIVDKMSVPYLDGATIDFEDTIQKQGFTIDNPNAPGSCACGDSFH